MNLSVRAFTLYWLLAPAVDASLAQSWLDTRADVDRFAAAGEYSSALELGPDLLGQVSEEFGVLSSELAETHLLLGDLKMAARDFAGAEDSILAAIDIYETNQGALSPVLIGPLVSLGNALGAGGAHRLALASYEQARGISRRVFGLFNERQVEILGQLAASTEALGDIEAAYQLRLEAIDLVRRAHGPASREAFVAVDSLAEWLSLAEYYREAGDQYRSLAFTFDNFPLENVRVLRLAAANYRQAANEFAGGNRPRRPAELLSALEIVDSLPGDLALMRAEILLELGDWYIVFQDKWSIEEAYLAAWDAAAALDNGDEIRREWFARTVPLRLAALRSRYVVDDRSANRGWVELEFTVNENGTADDIDVVSADPPDLIDGAARRRVDNSRFRPGIQDGRLVATRRSLDFEYFYELESNSDDED